jgi:hypothetical protein
MAAAVRCAAGSVTMQADGLVLRDIHASSAPPWWPPAPGWWLLFAALLVIVAVLIGWRWHRLRRRYRIERLFDDTVAAAVTPTQQVAAMSELLRRAARRRDRDAARLRDNDWLRFLDAGAKTPLFTGDVGDVLRDGGFRKDVDDAAVAALHVAARTRFVEWMTSR